ncbi:MAG: ester cyclase [Verrucomicrobiales bacterium]
MNLAENKAAARRFFEEIWNLKDETAIDRYSAADVQGNDPDFGTGREQFKVNWRERITAFPDLHFEITDMIAEGDQVLTRWVMTGTHQGAYLGAPATGIKVRVEGMSLDTIKDGVVVAGCDGWDALGFRQQLGLIPKD